MTLGDYLKSNRIKLADFARDVGVSEAAMSRYVAGKRLPRREILQRIAVATGGMVQANDFLGDGGPAEQDAAAAWLADHPEIEAIDLIVPDLNGILRGKRVPRSRALDTLENGIRLPGSCYALDVTGENVSGAGLVWSVGDADKPVVAVAKEFAPVPWAARPTAQVLMSMRDDDGGPFWAEPRTVLDNVVDRFKALGLTPVMALELEFYLIDVKRDDRGRPRPPIMPASGRRQASTQVYGIDPLDDFADMLAEIDRALAVQNVPAEAAIAEYAPGQYEVNLHHVADPVAACDHAVLLKRAIKGVAARHGVQATFMAKPYGGHVGNGLHLHLSLLDEHGRNVFDGGAASGPDMVSPALRHAIGGLAASMADMMAVFAPNANSYRRFRPGSYAPLAPSWGIDNRTVALRIPGGPGAARRIEHRVAGADANPYLTAAAVLAGVHDGIVERRDPPPRTKGNAYEKVTPSLPITWTESLARFAESDFVESYFGAAFRRLYAVCKRAELAKFEAHVSDRELDWYLGL